jgi:hypothetical protein
VTGKFDLLYSELLAINRHLTTSAGVYPLNVACRDAQFARLYFFKWAAEF